MMSDYERVETAFRVLADTESRRAYDASLRAVEPHAEPELRPEDQVQAVLEMEAPLAEAGIEPFEELEEEPGGDFDGPRLRRSRSVTRISCRRSTALRAPARRSSRCQSLYGWRP